MEAMDEFMGIADFRCILGTDETSIIMQLSARYGEAPTRSDTCTRYTAKMSHVLSSECDF